MSKLATALVHFRNAALRAPDPITRRLRAQWERWSKHSSKFAASACRAFCQATRESFDEVLPGVCFACRSASALAATALCANCQRELAAACSAQSEIEFWPPSQSLRCFATVFFEAPVSDWIHRFKYPRPGLAGLDPGPARALAALLVDASRTAPRPHLIVPVPLHPTRLRVRGFNPALLLAQRLAAEHRIALDPDALVRVRNTPSQTALDPAARAKNVLGAFQAVPRKIPLHARIWLVDDVITTGSTLGEAARVLRQAGATEIFGIAVARTRGLY